MSQEAKIIELLKSLGKAPWQQVFPAIVQTVDEERMCADVSYEGLVLYNVRLKATVEDGDHVTVVPALNSSILVGVMGTGDNQFYMVAASTPQKVSVKIGTTTVVIGSGGVLINNGDLGGMLVSGKTIDELAALKNDLNALKTAFQSWVTVSGDGGAALKAITATWFGQQLPAPNPNELVNLKVKQ
jgi:hypothetical protein